MVLDGVGWWWMVSVGVRWCWVVLDMIVFGLMVSGGVRWRLIV